MYVCVFSGLRMRKRGSDMREKRKELGGLLST